MSYPMLLSPALKEILWGGTKLKENFPFKTDLTRVAEAWVLSGHKQGSSRIENGEYAGQELPAVTVAHPALLGEKGAAYDEFPLLIKLIDAAGDLSIQVHPDDTYALEHEGEYGKTEMWYIMDADPGAFLYMGFKQDITKDQLRKRIDEGSLCEVLNRVECKAGDVFFIPSGTVHAINKGILLCEIQQSSNTTYRVFDYHRLGPDGKPRALHVEKAVDVADRQKLIPTGRPQGQPVKENGLTSTLLAGCEYFESYHWALDGSIKKTARADSFGGIVLLSGKAVLTAGDTALELAAGSTVFLPAGLGDYTLSGKAEMIYSTL